MSETNIELVKLRDELLELYTSLICMSTECWPLPHGPPYTKKYKKVMEERETNEEYKTFTVACKKAYDCWITAAKLCKIQTDI